jgi:ATP-binding cassette, subfamily B, bacterial
VFLRERRALRLANFRAREFWIGTAAWIAFFAYPLFPGWLISRAYGELRATGSAGARLSGPFWTYCVGLLLAEVVMGFVLWAGHRVYMMGFESGEALIRANAIGAQLASGGPERGERIQSAGDAVARLRDDPHDLLMLIDNWVDVFGALVYAVFALAILASVDPLAAATAILPLGMIAVFNRVVGNHIRKLRSRARSASSDTTDFLAAAFGGALTVKVSGASIGVLQRIDSLNKRRSKAMVADQTWSDALWLVNGASVDICVGLSLLVAARRNLEVGEISLFVAYVVQLIWLPQKLGGLVVGRRRFEVSSERLDSLVAAATPERKDPLTTFRDLPVLGGPPAAKAVRPVRAPLETLEVRNLHVLNRNVRGISFTALRGSVTIISGAVGTGKTSLLRALIGLIDTDSGVVLWNGTAVHDRARFFVPPNCAYVAQVPQLFSETLLDNVLLGSETDPTDAFRLAAFDQDVARFENGLQTRLGAGGVRLSGGQAQRAAAARALVHNSELIVFDDLTSALDIETELAMWDRLRETSATVIAVSNRAIARNRADQIIELGPALEE